MDTPTPSAPRREQLSSQPVSVRLAVPFAPTRVTYVLLGINVLLWLAMSFMGGSTNPYTLVAFGAKYNPFIAEGQVWRLLTCCFLHIGFVHLALNGYALWALGNDVERRFGYARFVALYLIAGLSGSVFSYLGNDSLAAGASGAIFGLIGAISIYFVIYRQQFGRWGGRRLTSLGAVLALNLIYGLTVPGIDNLAHIGGLLAGAILGWAYCPRYEVVPDGQGGVRLVDRPRWTRAAVVSVALLLVLGALVAFAA